jgi:hypothetical protein
MKLSPSLCLLPVALVAGFFAGRRGENEPQVEKKIEVQNRRQSQSAPRSRSADPFGGPSFSLSSMGEVRELFKKQSYSVASARLTLSTSSLSADQILPLMQMVQQDARDNPNDYQGRYALMGSLFERWAEVDPLASIDFLKSCKQRSFQMNAMGSCYGAIAKVDPDLAVRELEKLPKGEVRSQCATSVVMAISQDDPAGALDLLEKESSRGGFDSYYSANIFSTWAKSDPVAAAARMGTMPAHRVEARGAGMLAASWAQKDPEAALKWANTLKGRLKTSAATEVYKALAREDPAAAWARLAAEPGHMRSKLMAGVLEPLADEDPEKAIGLLKSLGSKSEKRIAANQFLNELSWGDTQLGFDVIEQLDDPAIRRAELGDLMRYSAYGSPQVLKERLGTLTEREKIDTASSVIRGLLQSDPEAAGKYFLALPEAQRSTASLGNMMQQYASSDPKGAFEFAIALTNPQEQTQAVNGVFSNWSQQDPEAAAEGWKRLPAGQSRLEALDGLAVSWAASDPEAAKQWADGLDGDERARALAAVLPAMAQDNPSAAASQLTALISSPADGMEKNLSASAGKLAGQWANDDPASAANWASALPEGKSRDEGLKAVSSSWSQYDAIATAQWLGTLERGSARDAAIQPLVNQVRSTDPGTAFSWAATIGDENQRLNQLRQTLTAWRASDLNAARAALDAAHIPEKEKDTLAKELK